MRIPQLARRAGSALLLIWLVVTLTFVLVRLAPGDPAAFLLPPGASSADEARLRADLGLDRSMAVQYARWLSGMLQGDMGASFASGRPVVSVLAEAAPISLWLGGASLALTAFTQVEREKLISAGFTDRIDKPIDAHKVVDAIRTALHENRRGAMRAA